MVKVERPDTGDDTRQWGPPYDAAGEATYFLAVNRNKRSVAIDLATDEGRAAARALALASDVLVENFKPGTLERMGLGFDDLHAEHPGLVFCSITGFGAGEGRDLPGYDLVLQAVGGLMSITGPAPGAPTKVGVALVDVIAGLHASVGHPGRAAAPRPHRRGAARRDLAAVEPAVGAGEPGLGLRRRPASCRASWATPIRPSRRTRCIDVADGRFVVAVGNDRQFAALCAVVERPELAEDPRFATNADRVRNRAELNRELSPALARARARSGSTPCARSACRAGRSTTSAGRSRSPNRLGWTRSWRSTIRGATAPARQVRNPIGLSATPPRTAARRRAWARTRRRPRRGPAE